MGFKNINPKDLNFDLKKPCKDCPFLKGNFHEGVAKQILDLIPALDMGNLAFTCHKTDPDSDAPQKNYKGKLQHCGGLLVMMTKDASLLCHHQARAMDEGRWKPERMDIKSPVWGSFMEMIQAYYKWASKLLADRKKAKAQT